MYTSRGLQRESDGVQFLIFILQVLGGKIFDKFRNFLKLNCPSSSLVLGTSLAKMVNAGTTSLHNRKLNMNNIVTDGDQNPKLGTSLPKTIA